MAKSLNFESYDFVYRELISECRNAKGYIEIPLPSEREATDLRFNLYGFRKALGVGSRKAANAEDRRMCADLYNYANKLKFKITHVPNDLENPYRLVLVVASTDPNKAESNAMNALGILQQKRRQAEMEKRAEEERKIIDPHYGDSQGYGMNINDFINDLKNQ